MTTRTITHASITLAATAALLLTGCQNNGTDAAPAPAPAASAAPSTPADNGVAALTPEQILQRARTAMKGATSFYLKGDIKDEGERTVMDFTARGKDLSGSMAMGAAKVELLAVGGKQYIKPNEKFWAMMGDAEQAKAFAKLIGDRWAEVPAGNGAEGGTLYVATVGEPYPLRIEGPSPGAGQMSFSEFGTAFPEIKPPADAEVIDFEELVK